MNSRNLKKQKNKNKLRKDSWLLGNVPRAGEWGLNEEESREDQQRIPMGFDQFMEHDVKSEWNDECKQFNWKPESADSEIFFQHGNVNPRNSTDQGSPKHECDRRLSSSVEDEAPSTSRATTASANRRGRSKVSRRVPAKKGEPKRRIGGLSVARTRWYYCYRKHSYSHAEAMTMAKEPQQPSATYKMMRKRQRDLQSDLGQEQEDVIQRQDPVGTGDDFENDWDMLRIRLTPFKYPEEKLTHQQQLDLEEAVILEIQASSTEHAVRLKSIAFHSGYLKIECYDKFTANWLIQQSCRLTAYTGPAVQVKLESDPCRSLITVFLPRSADTPNEYILGVLKSQNSHNVHNWRVISRRDQGTGSNFVFSIDPLSATEIKQNDHRLFYRARTVPVKGLDEDISSSRQSAEGRAEGGGRGRSSSEQFWR